MADAQTSTQAPLSPIKEQPEQLEPQPEPQAEPPQLGQSPDPPATPMRDAGNAGNPRMFQSPGGTWKPNPIFDEAPSEDFSSFAQTNPAYNTDDEQDLQGACPHCACAQTPSYNVRRQRTSCEVAALAARVLEQGPLAGCC